MDAADLTGESNTEAEAPSLKKPLETSRFKRTQRRSGLDLAAEFRRLEVLDHKGDADILGYDDNGLPS